MEIHINSMKREEFIDITGEVRKAVRNLSTDSGGIMVYVPHTTAGILINENADPAVCRDILDYLEKNVPRNSGYLHEEGNSDAHIKSSLLGNSLLLLVKNGEIVLGRWQGIFFAEFDGPRPRKVLVGKC